MSEALQTWILPVLVSRLVLLATVHVIVSHLLIVG